MNEKMVARRLLYIPGPLARDHRLQTDPGRSGKSITVFQSADGRTWIEVSDRGPADDLSAWSRGEVTKFFAPVDISHLPDEGWNEICRVEVVNCTSEKLEVHVVDPPEGSGWVSFVMEPGGRTTTSSIVGEGYLFVKKGHHRGYSGPKKKVNFMSGVVVEITPDMIPLE